ncbi:MAG: hypothetical protein JW731_11180, partial [Bacteroidales bacterium]|nr:hypothetical protein [Bacteroidales bacterium]
QNQPSDNYSIMKRSYYSYIPEFYDHHEKITVFLILIASGCAPRQEMISESDVINTVEGFFEALDVENNNPDLMDNYVTRDFTEYVLDTDLIARFIFAMLPHKPPYRLAMDRTNWKFGSTNINILVLAIVYEGVAFPILLSMMLHYRKSVT